ncbi:MAG: sigma 54-interacting transcriptional regulator, partial [Eubacteriales bacterium]|nr:sigma 54-interacting transcriptional regulator [Eubacteriales bacterium]
YAIDQEKNNAFEIQAMLDSSFSILIRFDRNGFIKAVNRSAITRFNWKQTDFRGKPVQSLFSGLTQQQLQQVLYAGKTLHSVFIHIGEEQFVANLTPVRTAEGTIIGGVLSCDEVSRIENVSVSIRREQQRLLHPALRSFDSLICRSPQMRQLREAAEIFAQSDSPILIQTGPGYDPLQLAECIHNASPRKDMPFVTVDCAALRPEEQLRYIFGSFDAESRLPQSLCAVAHLGTLYLQNPEHLCPEAQNRLFRLVTQKNLMNPETHHRFLGTSRFRMDAKRHVQSKPFNRSERIVPDDPSAA